MSGICFMPTRDPTRTFFFRFISTCTNLRIYSRKMLARSVLRSRQLVPNINAFGLSSSASRLICHGGIQPLLSLQAGSRGFRKIQVSNPTGIKFLRLSKSLGKGLLVFYVFASATVLFYYFRETNKSDGAQMIPADWTFKVKSLVREGVNHELDDHFDQALNSYQFAINAMTKDDNGNLVLLDNKSPEWLTGYADVLARIGRIQELFEKSDEAKAAFEASFSNPWGTPELKSVSAVQLAKYAFAQGDLKEAEEYFVNSIRVVADSTMTAHFKAGDFKKGVLIPDQGEVNIQLYNASIELGKFYASTGRFTESMEVFLATLRSIKQKREPEGRDPKRIPDRNCFEARVMSYISEVLWATGKKQDAVTWVESSYYESYPLSSSTVECGLCAQMAMENAAKMYKVS